MRMVRSPKGEPAAPFAGRPWLYLENLPGWFGPALDATCPTPSSSTVVRFTRMAARCWRARKHDRAGPGYRYLREPGRWSSCADRRTSRSRITRGSLAPTASRSRNGSAWISISGRGLISAHVIATLTERPGSIQTASHACSRRRLRHRRFRFTLHRDPPGTDRGAPRSGRKPHDRGGT